LDVPSRIRWSLCGKNDHVTYTDDPEVGNSTGDHVLRASYAQVHAPTILIYIDAVFPDECLFVFAMGTGTD
jgi:hypothetical protein